MKRKSRKETGINRNYYLFYILLIFLSAGYMMPVKAQCEAVNEAFKAGEVLTYDLYFNWKFIWVRAGDAKLSVTNATYDSKPAYRTDLIAITNKRADRFFKMRDTITGILTKKLEPMYFRKGAEEGKSYTVDEAWFTHSGGLSFVNQKRVRKDGKVILTEGSDTRCIYDMLSILAQARSFDTSNYVLGQRIGYPIATGRRVDEQILIYKGKEEFEANDDKETVYRCLVFSLIELKDKKEKEIITFYITDDKNHLPVRLDMFLNFGSAKAFLKNIKGNRHPLTSVIKKKKD